MTDLSEFEALSRTKSSKPPCKVGRARDLLDEQAQAQLDAAIAAQDRIRVGAIVEWFARRGHQDVNNSAVISHRSGICTCAND